MEVSQYNNVLFSPSHSIRSQSLLSEVCSEIIVKYRIKYGSTSEAAVGIFMEYCRNSSIHGIRYLGERRRPLIERIFWVLTFVASIIICSHLIANVWRRWQETPVIVSFSEKSANIWDIPFPSVIVCPETKARVDAFNFTKVYNALKMGSKSQENVSSTDIENLQAYIHLCELDLSPKLKFTANDTVNIEENLFKIADTMNDSVPFCKFRTDYEMCEYWFTNVLTDDGVCFQFNGLNSRDLLRDPRNSEIYNDDDIPRTEWILENGYSIDDDENVYPYRVIAAGKLDSLIFALQGNTLDMKYSCRLSRGFRVYLQAPNDAPQAAKQFFRVPFSQEVLIKITPNFQTTSENLVHYKPSERQCFFSHERYLRFFKIYTQKNCDYECLVNFTISKCGCVKYSMPKVEDIRICGFEDIKCYNDAEYEVLERERDNAIYSSKSGRDWKNECNCLPSCTSLEYNYEISQAHFDALEVIRVRHDDYLDEFPRLIMSRMTLIFSDQYFVVVKRSALYDTTDFLANCGGLLGLFMGFSLLSFIELVYFFLVRLISNIKMRWRIQRNGMPTFLYGDTYVPE